MAMSYSMPKPKMSAPGSSGKRMGPKMTSKRIGGIRTNFTQGIATPKMGKR
jgi:hypothetical protein